MARVETGQTGHVWGLQKQQEFFFIIFCQLAFVHVQNPPSAPPPKNCKTEEDKEMKKIEKDKTQLSKTRYKF